MSQEGDCKFGLCDQEAFNSCKFDCRFEDVCQDLAAGQPIQRKMNIAHQSGNPQPPTQTSRSNKQGASQPSAGVK